MDTNNEERLAALKAKVHRIQVLEERVRKCQEVYEGKCAKDFSLTFEEGEAFKDLLGVTFLWNSIHGTPREVVFFDTDFSGRLKGAVCHFLEDEIMSAQQELGSICDA